MFWKRSNLTKKEKEIRSYILEEHARTARMAGNCTTPFVRGLEDEARRILGNVLDILGG